MSRPAGTVGRRSIPLRQEADGDFDVAGAWAAHGSELYGFAVNGLGDRGAAEDCVQEVFLRAWRSRDRYSGRRGSQRTWLFAIARNVVVDMLRARGRRPTDPVADLAEQPVEGGQDVVTDKLVLLQALAQLSAEHREVVVAVHLDDCSYGQLAERTGVPVATLRTRMYYGMRELRTIMSQEVPGGGA